ncbi:lasso peptide biosynthesis PqqD family chaperone [Streptomyces sulphureus]|uniref:lasso peptide biosynthesis PqqD family chaperone n=1 Tax=Streptomyces sulphureus TaxID=47758 RepID=UPI00036B4C2D|nr:lasso peptide biosynthesis PqqD family chaperone [Streptomyces sulphureus]
MTLRLHPDVSTTALGADDGESRTDEGVVLLNERTGGYWQFNATGAFVLRLLLEGEEPPDIAGRLADHHRVEREQADRDVAAVVEELLDARLLVLDR